MFEKLTEKAIENIPEELRSRGQWICFMFEERNGMQNKIPKNPTNGKNASVSDPGSWASFQIAYERYKSGKYNGIGFVFTQNDPFCGIDLDSCRNPDTEEINPKAENIIRKLNSYSEISPSGTGVHVIVKSTMPGKRNRKDEFEIYDTGRWFTFTGNIINGSPANVENRQDEVEEVYKEIFGTDEGSKNGANDICTISDISDITDELIIQSASAARNGEKFQKLMDGDWQSLGYPSASEADAGLASILSFYTQDSAQLLRVIKQSGLWDEKWKRKDYQDRTIKFALEHTQARYEWERPILKDTPASHSTPMTGDLEFPAHEYMPPPGFLRSYIEYMLPMTEAPMLYHLFAGLTILATLVGPKIYYVIADKRKFCNLWIILIGPSGCKKSTCIDNSRQMLAEWGFRDFIYPTQVTPERLIPTLTTKSAGTFFFGEFGATFDQWAKSYAQDMIGMLTSLFDGGYFRRELKGEVFEIESSCVSIFAGSTPTWLKEKIKHSDISIGFWPRFLLVTAAKREKYLPMPPAGDALLRDFLQEQLLRTKEAFSSDEPIKINFDGVQDIYDPWYVATNKTADEDLANPYAASFVIRLSDYVKKLSALVEIASSNTVNIQPATMEYAIKLANWLKVAAIRVVTTVTRNELSEFEHRVLDVISQSGNEGIMHADLRHRLANYSKSQVDVALGSLEDAGDIEKIDMKSKGPGRPGKKYIPVHRISELIK